MKKSASILTLFLVMCALVPAAVYAQAAKTAYPVYMVHGVLGWDRAFDVGSSYFGDDWGISVADTCSFSDPHCNPYIDPEQEIHIVQLTSLQDTYFRGNELFDIIDRDILGQGLAALGDAADDLPDTQIRSAIGKLPVGQRPHVNVIGHSQGGIECRYVARRLRLEYGYTVVKVLVTVSAPHRGSGIAGSMYALKESQPLLYSSLLWLFEELWCGILANGYKDGKQQEGENMLRSMAYYDLPGDDLETGMQLFNNYFPIYDEHAQTYVNASKYVSFMTAEKRSSMSPGISVLVELAGDIDGNVYEMDPPGCPVEDRKIDRCDTADTRELRDDDGFIPIYSQHMGVRMHYTDNFWTDDSVEEIDVPGEVRDLDNPTPAQMGKPAESPDEPDGMLGVIESGHFQEITIPGGPLLNLNGGIGFDELGYYSSMIDYIARNE